MLHTAGPWIKRDTEIIGPFKSNKHICEITGNFMSAEEKEANTNLIAAAPDILEVLRMIIASHGPQITKELNDKAWEAINKALPKVSVSQNKLGK